jgi:hypothetical protein
MPKLGKYSYPGLSFDSAIDITRKFSKTMKGEASSSHALAELLGHKLPSGAFNAKLADLRKYGLLEDRGLKITTLGQKIAVPTNDQEYKDSIKESFLKIGLWKELYQKFGTQIPENNLLSLRIDITQADRESCKAQAGTISKLYKEGISYFDKEISESRGHNMPQFNAPSIASSDTLELISGDVHLKVPKNKINIRLLISALKNMETAEKSKKVKR